MALTVSSLCNHSTILENAIAKHRRFDKAFNGDLKYTLLYPDASEVKSTLPESDKVLTLQKYKDELGKPFSQITFFLCRVTDFLKSVLSMPVPTLSDSEESCHSSDDTPAGHVSQSSDHGASLPVQVTPQAPLQPLVIPSLHTLSSSVSLEIPSRSTSASCVTGIY